MATFLNDNKTIIHVLIIIIYNNDNTISSNEILSLKESFPSSLMSLFISFQKIGPEILEGCMRRNRNAERVQELGKLGKKIRKKTKSSYVFFPQ